MLPPHLYHGRFGGAKCLLPILPEDVGDALARQGHNHVIGVEKAVAQGSAQFLARSRLPTAMGEIQAVLGNAGRLLWRGPGHAQQGKTGIV